MQLMEPMQSPGNAAFWTCTPHSKRAHFHVSWSDFADICDHDTANGDVLRYFQWQTDDRIKALRKRYDIPDGELPPEDMLWMEAPYAQIEVGINRAQSDSTICRRVLAVSREERMRRQKKTEEEIEASPRSLIELGFLRRRIVARPDGQAERPATKVHEDENGPFIVVQDDAGNYLGSDGKQHNAICEGFVMIVYQYLYMVDKVNAAIAAYDFRDPPAPAKRWSPDDPPGQKKERSSHDANQSPASLNSWDVSYQVSAKTRGAQGVCSASSEEPSSINDTKVLLKPATLSEANSDHSQKTHQNLVPHGKRTQLHRDTIDAEAKQSAKWTPETIIDLLSLVLDIPAREAVDAKLWREKVEEPAEWIFEHPIDVALAPRYLWEDLYKRVLWTKHDAFWAKTRVYPENLVGRSKVTGQLAGHNWERMPGDWRKAGGWNPPIEIEYFGPEPEPIADYQSGYSAQDGPETRQDEQETACPSVVDSSDQAVENLPLSADEEETRDTDEMPVVSAPPMTLRSQGWTMPRQAPLEGMSREYYERLKGQIEQTYPGLCIGHLDREDGSVYLCIWWSDEDWHEIRSPWEWARMPAIHQDVLDRAIAYAATLNDREMVHG